MATETAWERIYGVGKFAGKAPQGSSFRRKALEKLHANNAEFQGFLQKHNLNVGMSVAQAGKKQVVDKKVAAERAALSNKAYGGTTGTKMGGEHGSNDEYKDTTVPLTPEQHSKVKAAAAAAKKAETTKVASKPTKSSSKLRGAALFNYLLDLESPKPTQQVKSQRASNLRSLAPDQNNYGETYNDDAHQDMSDLHHSLHIPLGGYNIDESVNVKQIKKDLDSGMSHDAIIGKHANKKLTNTNEIRKVIQQHAWEKRMKKEEVEQIEEGKNDAKYNAAMNRLQLAQHLGLTDMFNRGADEMKKLYKTKNPLHTTAHGLMRTASKLKAGSPEREAVTNALKNVVGAIKEAKSEKKWTKFANKEAGKKKSWSDWADKEEQENHQPTIIKDKKGNPIGEVGVDPSGSLGVGPYYIKHYASGRNLGGYNSHKEAASELRHYAKLEESGIQGGIGDVDYIPSWSRNTAPQNCTDCHGRKSLWMTPQGETFADRRTEDSTQIHCPKCSGRGWLPEEVEQLDEKYDKTSAAHLAAKRAARGMRSYIKPVFHPDGSATLHIHGDKDLSSTEVVDGHYKENDLGYNRPREDYKRFSRTKDGLKYATKETGPNSHEMRITSVAVKEEAEQSDYLNNKITEARQRILNKLATKMGKK